MKYTFTFRANYALLILLFFSFSAFAQLPNFTLTVTPTAQTCLGNGSLSFAVSGNNMSASIDYTVYLLPNTTTPVSTITTATLSGLVSGTYQVVATQSLNGQSNTATATATIANNVIPITYNLVPTQVRCGNDGKITVSVTGGAAATYEITAGPVTAPAQTSPVFNNLPIGLYTVRVYDTCGEALVKSTTLIQLSPGISISNGGPATGLLPTCSTISVMNQFVPVANKNIFYPLTVQFTIFPPGGGTPVVVTGTASGDAESGEATANIPFYYDQAYSYTVVITDACGNTYTKANNVINKELEVGYSGQFPNCNDRMMTLTPMYFRPPYTITFTNSPAGFNPVAFNSSHPTFTGESAVYGSIGNPVPTGDYSISLTDACGHTVTLDYTVEPPPVNPSIAGAAACGSTTGTISIIVPNRAVAAVTIMAAPPAYVGTLPDDVSDLINDFGGFEIFNTPLGSYTFFITDTCGDTYTEIFNLVVTGGAANLSFLQRPGCDEGYGSVRIQVSGTQLSEVIITAAPAAFTPPLPYNASANIAVSNGGFYMNTLPAGTYTFKTTDVCGIVREEQYTINGYTELQNNFTVIPHCGAFDLQVAHTATTGTYLEAFWLQRYNTVTGTWGHPQTGVPYADGTLPAAANSILLTNNATMLTLGYTGQFRVIKVFYVFANGSTTNARCMHEVANFVFEDAPEITDAYSFPCAGGDNEVIIEATGVAPLTYKITTKNNEPFVVNNDTSNLFSGLETATYNFQVSDVCGNIRNIQFDINTLDPVEIEAAGFCEGEDSTLSIEEFSFLTYEWYEQSAPGTILSTTGTLTFPDFSSVNDAGIYILEITYSANTGSCLNQSMEYVISPNTLPNAGADNSASVCNDGATLNLTDYLTAPFDAGGTWAETTASGQLTGNQFNTSGVAAGTYTFTYTVAGVCALEDVATINITLKEIPAAPVVLPVVPVCENENVQLFAGIVNGGTYQWTGPNGFTSTLPNPLIAQAAPSISGIYSVTVTVNGCTSPAATVNVLVNPLPQFTISGTTLLCDGQSSILSVVPGNFAGANATYAWFESGQPMGITTSGIEVFATGTYEVTVTLNGCSATESITVEPNLNAFSFDLDAGCVDEAYIISVINLNVITNAQYEWSGPNGYSYTGGPDADITERATGDYTVTVTSADGCAVSQTINVTNTYCSIPRGISPNGDEWNNNFDLSNLGVQHLIIFNRYGLKVYEANNYVDEWHGQSGSGDLPTGTYYYVATLSAGLQKTGWVYLQREVK